jgi:hypothetical protein
MKSTKSIREQENHLFARWRKKRRPHFIPDGCVHEATYRGSQPKLLFVLKEANETEGNDVDLRRFVAEGARSQTWNNIARWVLGLRTLYADRPIVGWNKVEHVSDEMRCEQLRGICAMNLKKLPGAGQSDAEFETIAVEDADEISEQFNLYHAQLAVCCGTYIPFCKALGVGQAKDEVTKRGVLWYNFHNCAIIDYWHPQAHYPSNLMLYGLLDAAQEIRNKLGPCSLQSS